MEKSSKDTGEKLLPLPVKQWPVVLDPETNMVETLSGRRVALMGEHGLQELCIRPIVDNGDTLDTAVDSGRLTHSR